MDLVPSSPAADQVEEKGMETEAVGDQILQLQYREGEGRCSEENPPTLSSSNLSIEILGCTGFNKRMYIGQEVLPSIYLIQNVRINIVTATTSVWNNTFPVRRFITIKETTSI